MINSDDSTELPTVNPIKEIWVGQTLTTIRSGGEFAPGEEIKPGNFHQANLSIIGNLYAELQKLNPCQSYTLRPRPLPKLPKT